MNLTIPQHTYLCMVVFGTVGVCLNVLPFQTLRGHAWLAYLTTCASVFAIS